MPAFALFALCALPSPAAIKPDEPLKNWQVLSLPTQYAPDAPTPGVKVIIAGRDFIWRPANAPRDRITGDITTFAFTEFEVPAKTTAILSITSTAPVQIRVNDTFVSDQPLVAIGLHAGKNQFLLKAQTPTTAWTFDCRLTTRAALIDRMVAESLDPGEVEAIQSILDTGLVDVNSRNSLGLTALQAARLKGHAELAALLLARGASPNLPRPSPATLVDAQFRALITAKSPGLAVLVAQNGTILFERGYGLADIRRAIPLSIRTEFRIGSITKQFTAALILKLQEEGKLKVTDPLSSYIPNYPRGNEITLAQLLSHTSGIHNYTEHADFTGTVQQPVTPVGLVDLFRNDPLDFTPGTRWYYSNSNYVLLAYIIEQLTGQTYSDFLRRKLFVPLGMNHTGVHNAAELAHGYQYLDNQFIPALPWDMSRALGAACLYSTVEDLYRWNEALFHDRVLSAASLAAALTPATPETIEDPPAGGYGYGWFISQLRGSTEIQHGGSLHGFSSFLLRVPSQNLTVVVLANSQPSRPGIDTARLARDTAEFYIGEQLPPVRINRAIPGISSKALDAIAGRYDLGPATMIISVEEGRVYARLEGHPRNEIFPRSETKFLWKTTDAELTFVKDSSGKVTRLVQYHDGYTIDAPRLATLDASSINAILGRYDYRSYGIPILTITRVGDRVFAQVTGQFSREILPRSATEFYWKGLNSDLTFIKDLSGKVTKAIQRQDGQLLEGPKIE
jgi:CubicO group peptidase (beta-lactamase class C family)